MVDFVPNVPQSGEPNWLGWSKPISQPEPDKSKGMLFKTIGHALEGAAEVGGSVVKGLASSGAEDILNTQIESTEADTTLLKTQDPNNQSLPQDVAKAKTIAENLGSSKANGAITQTYYLGKLLQYQKDMRSQFPMYKNQIDEGIRQATGVAHTANEYYTHLLQDLNSYLTAKDERGKQALNEAFQGDTFGAPGVKQAVQAYRDNPTKDNVVALENTVANIRARDYQRKQAVGDLALNKDVLADANEQSKLVADNIANKTVNDRLGVLFDEAGIRTPADIMDALDPTKHSPQEMQALYEKFGTLAPRLRAEISKKFNEPQEITIPETGRKIRTTLSAILGPEAPGVIDRAMAGVNDVGTWIKDGNWGAAKHYANMDAAVNQAISNDLDRTDMGFGTRLAKILKDRGAPEWLNKLTETQLQNGLAGKVGGIINTMMLKSYIPGDVLGREAPGAKKTSFQQDVDTVVRTLGKNQPALKSMISDTASLDDPKMPIEQKAAKVLYYFGPQNTKVLSAWKPEDQAGAFSIMTSEPVVKAAREADRQYPGLWNEFKSTASTLADNAIHNQIPTLNQFQVREGWKVNYVSNPGVDGFHGWVVEPPRTVSPVANVAARNIANQTVNRINTVVRRLVDIAKSEGRDPDAYVFQTLKNIGYENPQPGKEDTLPAAMADALRNTRAKAKQNAEEEQRRQDALRKEGEQMLKEKRRPQ